MTTGQITPLPSGATIFPPTTWDGAPFYAGTNPSLTVMVTVAPTTAYTPQWSADGVTWANVSGQDRNFNPAASIGPGFTGPIDFDGFGWFRLFGGAGATFLLSGGL